jgi:hypothetical protein
MTSTRPSPPDRRYFLLGRIVRLFALALFVLIGCLTVPKIAPRMKQLFVRRDARVEIANRAVGRAEMPLEDRVRAADVAWIAAVATGGLLILAPLGYFALRPRNPDR